ncbi:MAG: MarR family transcriptional regulator [Xanthomonadales bacterium]|jgi:DNA-binding MarR family transcriptional regulator|nr:MarR family transcriptional regulator [Xanthomonadales bacterium]
MKRDPVDKLQHAWVEQDPELEPGALGVVLRIQALARVFMLQAESALDDFGLTWSQYDVLSALLRQGEPFTLSPGELMEEASLSSGAMTTRIDGLLEAGWVTRVRDEVDRRRVLVALTPAGRALVEEAAVARFAAAEAALSQLPAAKRKTLNGLLRDLLAAQG